MTREKSSLEELYHLPEDRQSILIDPSTRKILLRKELEYYNLQVFEYLKNHRSVYIPEIENYYESDGRLIVEEEFIQGRTLAQILEEDGLDEQEKKKVFLAVLDGVSFLHHADPPIIHRDLKASNILITGDGQVKIIDYDAAKVYKPHEKRDTVLIGTEGSAAPEQYGFGASDQRTDIYALGILLKQLFGDNPDVRFVADKASMMDPDDRYSSVEEMKKAFLSGREKTLIPDQYRKYLPPGFRTLTIWKMLAATIGYALIFYVAITLQITDSVTGEQITGYRLTIYKFVCFFLCMSELDFFAGWTGIFEKMPLIRSENILLRITGYILGAVLIFCFWIVVLGLSAS